MTEINRKTDVDRRIVQFIKLGHEVSLYWTVRIPNYPTLVAAMNALGAGNEFDPERIAATFEPLFDESMSVEFGREASEVLYVHIPFHAQQRHRGADGQHGRISDEDRIAFAQRVIDWAKEMHADEISGEQFGGDRVWNAPGDNPHRIRVWWD